MKELKQLVSYLVEAAISGQQASGYGLALCRVHSQGAVVYVLYNPQLLPEIVREPEDVYRLRYRSANSGGTNLSHVIFGYTKAIPHKGDCFDATEIKYMAAEKGYGPLMYEIVLSDSDGGIMPDRGSTSSAAKNVWQKFASRPDIKAKQFTADGSTRSDSDCELVHDDKYLNAAYDGAGQSGAKAKLMLAHEDSIAEWSKKDITAKALDRFLMYVGESYFAHKYD